MQNNKKDRGMIKWRPFSSLPEHMEMIEKRINSKQIKKAQISNDKLEEINEIVGKSIKNSTKLVLKLYKRGNYSLIEGIPLEFDFENKLLKLKIDKTKKYISIFEIVDVYEKNY